MIKYFYLPGYYRLFNMFCLLDIYKQKHEEYFRQDRIIAGAYDLPIGLIWNGGRYQPGDFDAHYTDKVIKYFQNKDNFILLHTCTNLLINTDELCQNELCNNFIKNYYRQQDKIIIANSKLKEYLLTYFNNISFVNSTTLGITDVNQVNTLSEKEIYVLYYGKNNDNNYLSQLQYKNNIEILCAEPCIPNCPNRKQHYESISKMQLENQQTYDACPFLHEEGKKNIPKLINTYDYRVNNNRIDELSALGFNHFKLSGRNYNPNAWIQLIVYYLSKPYYMNQVYKDLSKFSQFLGVL